ncbi:MAG: TetR/AcrR family transcriptional regulator, partial [Actinomycetes bacterium]
QPVSSPAATSLSLSRERVVEAARAAIDEAGADGLSLRQVARRLHVTAPALYAYVDDKQDLLAAVAATGFAELTAEFEAITAEGTRDELHQMASVYVSFALRHPELFRAMFRFRPSVIDVPDADNTLDAATEMFVRCTDVVAAAQREGLIHPDRDPLQAMVVLWTATHGSASVLLLGAADGTAREIPEFEGLVDEMVAVTLAGLATAPTTASA